MSKLFVNKIKSEIKLVNLVEHQIAQFELMIHDLETYLKVLKKKLKEMKAEYRKGIDE